MNVVESPIKPIVISKNELVFIEKLSYNISRFVQDIFFCENNKKCFICGSSEPRLAVIGVKFGKTIVFNEACCNGSQCIDDTIEKSKESLAKNIL